MDARRPGAGVPDRVLRRDVRLSAHHLSRGALLRPRYLEPERESLGESYRSRCRRHDDRDDHRLRLRLSRHRHDHRRLARAIPGAEGGPADDDTALWARQASAIHRHLSRHLRRRRRALADGLLGRDVSDHRDRVRPAGAERGTADGGKIRRGISRLSPPRAGVSPAAAQLGETLPRRGSEGEASASRLSATSHAAGGATITKVARRTRVPRHNDTEQGTS